MVFTVFGATNGNNNNDPDCNKTCDKIIEPQLEDKIYNNTQHSLYPRDREFRENFQNLSFVPSFAIFQVFSKPRVGIPTYALKIIIKTKTNHSKYLFIIIRVN